MKKQIVATALAAAVASCMGLAGCSGDNSTAPKADSSAGAKMEAGQVANPIHYTDAAGVLEATGIELTPPKNIKDNSVVFSYVDDGENALIAQMTFTTKSGLDYTYRAQATSSTEPIDISGMYYTWTCTEGATVGHCEATVSSCDDATVCTWLDAAPGIAYSLSAGGKVPAKDIATLATHIFAPAQGEN